MPPTTDDPLQALLEAYKTSPHPCFKVSNYFPIYAELFAHLRGTDCTFIETGILNGGSLFMWRKWLGPRARIVGIDLNPEAEQWRAAGFEIFIGDQGDPDFWRRTLQRIGKFDVLLDDGGHQSFQQIVTLTEALRVVTNRCVIAIEDTITSFMTEFARHRQHAFSEYAKDATDNLLASQTHLFPGQSPSIDNPESVQLFQRVYSIQFFVGLIAFKVDPAKIAHPELIWNRPPTQTAGDFRYRGAESAVVEWPDPFSKRTVVVRGGR